ncbi:MAG: M20/M25/M40 family metallo-hydrolase [Fimbriimonadia bacterium]|jgi:arginine utilization protein RocB
MKLDPVLLAQRLVAQPSVTGDSASENRMADLIAEELATIGLEPGFWPTADGRKSVWALHRGGAGKELWVLTSHFDTVGIGDYAGIPGGDAFHPDTLVEPFATGRYGREVADDAKSGRYLFGRGGLDMKSGIAAQIAALASRPGANVLFLSCPDEEAASAGILSALPQVKALADAEGLSLCGVLNSDYTAPRFPGDENKYLYLGSVGKLLPMFLIGGIETHVGEPYRGLDACAIAAELVSLIDLNPDLCDKVGDEISVPPVTLCLRDLKPTYDVQTAFEAYAYCNLMTYSRGPGDALAALKAVAEEAVQRVLERRSESLARHSSEAERETPPELRPKVLLYQDLPAEAREAAMAAVMAHAEGEPDHRDISLAVARAAVERSRIEWPFVLILLAPPYYPHVHVRDMAFRARMQSLGRRFGMCVRDFYPYISDVSYIGGATQPEHVAELASNTPQWKASRLGYTVPEVGLSGLGCPVANIGPWGKDAHGVTERVEMDSIHLTVDVLLAALEP